MQLRRLAALERQKIIDRARRARGRDRRPRGHPRERPSGSAQIVDRGARRDRRQVRRRAAYPDHRGRRRPLDGGPDPRRGAGRLDHPRRLRQADPRRPVPQPEARRQGRARRDPARRRRGRALHRDDQPPLAAVLHHGRPGLPHQGLQPARGVSATPRAVTSPGCSASSPTSRSRRCWRSATTSRRRTSCWRPATAWSRRPGSATTTARARPASSRSTSARTTTS